MRTEIRMITIGIMLNLFLLAGCTTAPEVLPTATSIPPTATSRPTNTPMPTETPELFPALTSWNEIPIFPDAISGKEEFGDYQFAAKTPISILKAYYEQEMPKLGWELRPDMMEMSSSDLAFNKGDTFVFFLIKPEGDLKTVFIHIVQN